MKRELLFFKPIARKTVWGGTTVKEYFHYPDMEDGVGQAWAFADQPGGLSNECLTPSLSGMTLHEIWDNYPEVFNSRYEKFPFIISLVGPEDDLSIQLHPDTASAKQYGFNSGKDEAWYFLEASNSSLIYGHQAENQASLVKRLQNRDFDGLFRRIPAHKDDFVYLPAGIIHALGKNNVVYEIQQATDLTWRIYDYDRVDNEGQHRELHLSQALDVLNHVTDESIAEAISRVVANEHTGDGYTFNTYRTESVFSVARLRCYGQGNISKEGYWLCTVTEGSGIFNGERISCGDNFIVSAECQSMTFSGDFIVMITTETR